MTFFLSILIQRAQKHVLNVFPDLLQGVASSRIQFFVTRPAYSRGRYVGFRAYISKHMWTSEVDGLAEHEMGHSTISTAGTGSPVRVFPLSLLSLSRLTLSFPRGLSRPKFSEHTLSRQFPHLWWILTEILFIATGTPRAPDSGPSSSLSTGGSKMACVYPSSTLVGGLNVSRWTTATEVKI